MLYSATDGTALFAEVSVCPETGEVLAASANRRRTDTWLIEDEDIAEGSRNRHAAIRRAVGKMLGVRVCDFGKIRILS